MPHDNFQNAVYLDEEKCKGCTNCIRRCATRAIRVRGGIAHIRKEYCIDCGECIRICENHAKIAAHDSLDRMKEFEYTVAMPAPAFYAQFNNLEDTNIILNALKQIGFNDVFEVGAAAEIVSKMTRDYVSAHPEQHPLISTACPSVTRLIRIRFPDLIPHLLPIIAPVEMAATLARKKAMAETGLPSEKIGIFFISPCPAKVSSCRHPLGIEKTDVDAVLAIKDVYPIILPYMKQIAKEPEGPENIAQAGRIGIGWGMSGGEANGLLTEENYLAADGIENVINVLEELEDQKLHNLIFIELNACSGGCVGGVLTVENPYIAKTKLKRLSRYLPVTLAHDKPEGFGMWTREIQYEPVYNLSDDLSESMSLMMKVEEINKRLPGIDCGSCGAPTCRALAVDIVRGEARESDCIHVLKEYIHNITAAMSQLVRPDENSGDNAGISAQKGMIGETGIGEKEE